MDMEEIFEHAITLTPALITAKIPEIRRLPTDREICDYIHLAARGVERAWRELESGNMEPLSGFAKTEIPDLSDPWPLGE